MKMNVDDSEREKAIARIVLLLNAAKQPAEELVDAVLAGAVDQALELMNGSGPVPTSMVTARADQVRFICQRAGRELTQLEIAVLLRITSASARAVITTMDATYAEALRSKRLEWMRADATVTSTGTADTELTWTLRFTEDSTVDTAWSELQRIGVWRQSKRDDSKKTIEFPKQVVVNGVTRDALKELGLSSPKQKSRK